MLISEEILDGYKLVRLVGAGGFGEVWLCRMEATGERKALKFLPASASRHLEQELEALIRYRSVMAKLQCAHLLPIEHVNRDERRGLYYTMPLADGLWEGDPLDPAWQPKTLAALIAERHSAPSWFCADEILQIMLPILEAAQCLSDAGVVHRDIKPENLLFVGGQLVLGDISLLGDDESTLSGRGTPGYAPPSWYLESQGNPDMWGVATTFYSLLTGNAPDKVGRGAFLWPPQGEAGVDGALWRRWHQMVLRATQENPTERFLGFNAMAEALRHGGGFSSEERNLLKRKGRHRITVLLLLVLLVGASGWTVSRFWKSNRLSQPTQSAAHPDSSMAPRPASLFDPKLAEAKAQFERVLSEQQKQLVDAYLQSAHSQQMLELLEKLQQQGEDYLDRLDRNENALGDGIRKTCEEIETILPAYCAAHANYVAFRNLELDVTLTMTGGKAVATLREQVETADDAFRAEKLIKDYQEKQIGPNDPNCITEKRELKIGQTFTMIGDIFQKLGFLEKNKMENQELCSMLKAIFDQKEGRAVK